MRLEIKGADSNKLLNRLGGTLNLIKKCTLLKAVWGYPPHCLETGNNIPFLTATGAY